MAAASAGAAAEAVSATLDSLAEALLGPAVTRYPVTALRTGTPRAELFDTWLTQSGPGRLAIPGHGCVVSCAARQQSAAAPATVERLLARYGPAPVRGVPAALDAVPEAAAFHLPVSAEPSAARLRPAFAAPLAELAAGRHTQGLAELATGSGVEVRLTVPAAFHALTVRGTDQALAEQLGEVAEELFAADATTARRDWAVLTGALADEHAAAGVRFAGVAALEVDGRPSNASLVIALHRDGTPVAELAAELATSRPQAEVWTVILPSGPAVVLVQARTGAVPAALTADGTRRWVVSSVVQAFMPLPDGLSLLTVQLGTTHGEDWELYATVFADLLRSVVVGWDGVDARAALASLPVAPALAPLPAPLPSPLPSPAPAPAPAPMAAPVLAPAPVVVPPPPPQPPTPPQQPPLPPQQPPSAPPVAPEPAPVLAATPAPGKGTPVMVPPDDFDPFAPQAAEPAAAPTTAAPAPAPTAEPEPAPVVLDPFGTVMKNQPLDPFGTVTRGTPDRPAPPSFAAPARAAAPTTAPAAPGKGKGTPVMVPPDDFDPFAPQPAEPAAAPAPTKGTPVMVPPDDFDPFAPQPAEPAASTKGTPVMVPPDDFDPFAPQPATPAPAATPAAGTAPAKPDPFS
ncbi:serine/threonine-protein kinase [Kitasatospora azatica]|uniref:hypothetical protein n=1 Tax=Kitasatospora azatica TaxID=58347 RepID=UPI000565C7BB|nr:hypothetical protein [Kitasatospora azatica]